MIAEAMPQLVWTAKADGTIEYLNQRWIEYTGVDLDEFTRRGDDIGAVHPDDLAETWRLWRAAVKSGRPYEHEYRLRRASDGSFRWFLARGVPIRSDDGKIVRWIGTATDIDEHHRAGECLRFSSRVNQLLLETTDPWQAMERIAQMVASEIADACAILRLDGEMVRTETIVHRDPAVNAAIAPLRGRRTLRIQPETDLAERIKQHQTIVLYDDDAMEMKQNAWPYLTDAIEALGAKATFIAPWHAGSSTFGALVAHYSDDFDPRDIGLLEEIAHRASVALERAETLERERRIATTLQQASLPSLIPRVAGLRFDAVYAPAGEEADVGGDWYDAIELDDGSVVVSVGDVTGRGIQAAAIMSKVRHAMGMAPLHERDPSKILDSAGWFLRKRYPDAIVTAFVGIISPDRRMIRYANAGHPLPMLRRDGELIELHAIGLPLGLRQLIPADGSSVIDLRDGDILLLFTDGLIEGLREWEIGEAKLRSVMQTELFAASANPAKLVARSCIAAQVPDDVAILAVSVGAPPAWTLYVDDARAAVDARRSSSSSYGAKRRRAISSTRRS